jgi:hypothetical protein
LKARSTCLSLFLGCVLSGVAVGFCFFGRGGGGAAKQNRRTPRGAFAKSQTHPPTSRILFLDFFLVRFWAFFGEGSSKTPQKYFLQKLQKVHVENFPPKIDKNFHVSFSVTFFVL